MKYCPTCSAMLDDSARFCGGCGNPVPVQAPAPPPLPPAYMAPPPQAPPVPGFGPPAGAAGPTPATRAVSKAASSYGTTFEVLECELYRMARITLQNTSVTVEAGLLHYWIGQIQMHAQGPSAGALAKSFLTKEKAVRPVYSGIGEIYLEPTFGEIELLDLSGQETWILDKGAYLASDQGVQLGMYSNPLFTSMFGGEGMFQTQVSGAGKVMYWAPGPVQRIDLQGQILTVDGSFAVARTGSVDYRVEKATKGVFRSWMSGEGLVNVFSGYGSVMLAPVPNRYMSLIREFGGLHAAIRAIKRS